MRRLPPELPILAGAVFAGALVGSWLGASRLPQIFGGVGKGIKEFKSAMRDEETKPGDRTNTPRT